FPHNISDVCQQAAQNFEDILQCAIPVFEGLFPSEHDRVVCTLLFRLAHWHALAKLRLHSEDSLHQLDKTTRLHGHQLCKFRDFTCTAFMTMELPLEVAAWHWRKDSKPNLTSNTTSSMTSAQLKTFNLATYKFHALGDYVNTICTFGTTDLYTTQIISYIIVFHDR
ncbi:hypothetical protein M404DRAFT_152432, partial [Pisolithus tinctorius Marx 270]